MVRFFPMVLGLLATPALADTTITFRQPGNGMEAPHAFVDGTNVGTVRPGRKGLTVPATPGTHEVRIAQDVDGRIVWCHGTVDVQADGRATVSLDRKKTSALTCVGTATSADAASPSTVAFELTRGLDVWLALDGDNPTRLPRQRFVLHLSPGDHDIVLFEDVQEDLVIARQSVEVPADGPLRVRCTVGGCEGFGDGQGGQTASR